MTEKQLLEQFATRGIKNWEIETTTNKYNDTFKWFNQVGGSAQILTYSDGRHEGMVIGFFPG